MKITDFDLYDLIHSKEGWDEFIIELFYHKLRRNEPRTIKCLDSTYNKGWFVQLVAHEKDVYTEIGLDE